MDEVFENYLTQLRYFMDLLPVCEHINDEIHCEKDINAFRASLVADCIGRGMDLVEGGSIYSVDGGPTAAPSAPAMRWLPLHTPSLMRRF